MKEFPGFSDGLAHIVEFILNKKQCLINYLDDYIFCSLQEEVCNHMMETFLSICQYIGCPISQEKTEFTTDIIVFLGVLLNGRTLTLSLPKDKVERALYLLQTYMRNKKATIHFIQRLTGTLNFLNKVITPGRTFTRRMYDKLKLTDNSGQPLKQYHHVNLDKEFIKDCRIWEIFLQHADARTLCRPFIDFDTCIHAKVLNFYSDASLSIKHGGLGAVFMSHYLVGRWNKSFLIEQKLNI